MNWLNFFFKYTDFQIIEQPQEEIFATIGESVTVRTSAIGSGQLSYEWKKNQQEITDHEHYDGIDTAALTITSFSEKYQGDYMCIVKNDNVTIESRHANVVLSE